MGVTCEDEGRERLKTTRSHHWEANTFTWQWPYERWGFLFSWMKENDLENGYNRNEGSWWVVYQNAKASKKLWILKEGSRNKRAYRPQSLTVRHYKSELCFILILGLLAFINLISMKLKFDKMKFGYWSNNFPPEVPYIVPLDQPHSLGCCRLHLTEFKKIK